MTLEIPYLSATGNASRCYESFADPGPLPPNLTEVPGFIGELAGWTLAHSHRPNRTLAFAGALAMLAHLSGRSYTDRHGTHTNLYLVVLGDSGIGKDAPRKTNSRLADRVGISASVAESFASGEALEDALAKRPSLLLQADEVAAFFGKMRGAGGRAMSERIRRLYTSSASNYVIRQKAGKPNSGAQIIYPHLTLFGTGIPGEFLDSLTPKEISDGLFGRCLIFRAEDEGAYATPDAFAGFPKMVTEAAEMFAEIEESATEGGVLAMKVVDETPEAAEAFGEIDEAIKALRTGFNNSEMPMASAVVARMGEKIAKLALLWALSENPESPKITRAAVEWAAAFTVYVMRWMLFESQFHSSEGSFGKLRDRAIAALARNGGTMDRRTLLRAIKCDITNFKRLISTLVASEIIDEPAYIDGKLAYTLRKD